MLCYSLQLNHLSDMAGLQNPGAHAGQEAQEAQAAQAQVPLHTEQLVHALNEHVRAL